MSCVPRPMNGGLEPAEVALLTGPWCTPTPTRRRVNWSSDHEHPVVPEHDVRFLLKSAFDSIGRSSRNNGGVFGGEGGIRSRSPLPHQRFRPDPKLSNRQIHSKPEYQVQNRYSRIPGPTPPRRRGRWTHSCRLVVKPLQRFGRGRLGECDAKGWSVSRPQRSRRGLVAGDSRAHRRMI